MTDPRIEASKRLDKLPGIENCPWELAARYSGYIVEENRFETCTIVTNERNNNLKCDQVIGPWLRIEDGSKWSSKVIYIKFKAKLNLKGLGLHLYFSKYSKDQKWVLEGCIDEINILVEFHGVPREYFETATVLAICELAERYPDTWAYIMEELKK